MLRKRKLIFWHFYQKNYVIAKNYATEIMFISDTINPL